MGNAKTGWYCAYVPERMVACELGVYGACEYARVKTAESRASLSRLGVRPRVEPINPMRSARVVSSVIRMTLGYAAFGCVLGPGVPAWGWGAAKLLATRLTTHMKQRIPRILKMTF